MDKTLVVTGASSDMGTALISRIGESYAGVIVQFRTMNDALRKALDELSSKGVAVEEMQADLSDAQNDLAERIKQLGDVLAGNDIHFVHFPAPQCTNNKFHKIKWQTFEDEINISVRSFVEVSQTLIPHMMKAKTGRIVLLLSYLSENIPPKYCSNYITVKYALLGLLRAMAVEYSDKGITVNGVSPSVVETKYISNQPDVVRNAWIEKSPIGRNMTVDEVLPSIEFLLSESAARISGENIIISGGVGA